MGCFSRQHAREYVLEEEEINSTDDSLGCVANDLLLFLYEFKKLDNAKKEIEKKYGIEPQEHNCWTEDDIKKAWKETTKDKKNSRRRRHCSVIMLQIVKRFVCDTCKQNAAQKNRDATPVEQGCETTPNSEDASSQSSAELQREEAAGGVEQKSEKGSSNDKSARSIAELETEEAAGGGKRHFKINDSAESESEEAPEKLKKFGTTYIYIPLTKLFHNEPTAADAEVQNVSSPYKLIDGCPSDTDIRKRKSYTMSFSNVTKNAEWVYEVLNMNTLSRYKTPPFKYSDSDSDSEINDPTYQARNSNSFTNYDRGHLAAAANHSWCQEAYKDTYNMKNITPQNENLNRGRWKKLENDCRDFVKDDDVRNVHVYTGPLYLRIEDKSGEKTVHVLKRKEIVFEEGKAVPTHYFKVVIVEKKNGTVEEPKGFLIANKDKQIEEKKNIKYIEEISGLKFTETSEIPKLADVDHTRTATWKGNNGGKSVTIDVRISSFKENDARPHSLNEE